MPAVENLRRQLLAWYDAHARALAWRVGPQARAAGVQPDPYRTWLSEVLLQQTTVPHATPYFERFTERWPTVEALAAAEDAEVMSAWAGLGYYARARNLLACARVVVRDHGGRFPETEGALLRLPGVGAYTAAAVAAITFDAPANVVDGNVERVVARLFAVETPVPAAKPELRRLAGTLVGPKRAGDWAQALMDLGATICRPKSPLCMLCPVADQCLARASGAPERYPLRSARRAQPLRYGVAWVLRDGDRVALARRPERGLLGGTLGVPTSPWREQPWGTEEALAAAPVQAQWRDVGEVAHTFTHFNLRIRVLTAPGPWPGAIWEHNLNVLPTLFRKVTALALTEAPGDT